MDKKHEYGGEIFYLTRAPNGYLVVTHRGPVGSDDAPLVGYVGARVDGTPDHPYGWITPKDVPTDQHTHRGLASSNVADSPRIEDQLDALCQHYLEESQRERTAERNREEFNRIDTREEMDEFFDSLPNA